MAGLLDFIQGASNAAAGTVAGPVDLINMGLLGIGLPMPANPVGGSQWMRERGLMREPQNRVAGLLGEAAGNVLPIVAAAKAPQIAQGLLNHADAYRKYHAATTAPGAPATVWHGSPHRFDKFDSSKIGTGEGAQAYGHGLYFAESPEVAKKYAENLGAAHSTKFSIDGRDVDLPPWVVEQLKSGTSSIDDMVGTFRKRISDASASKAKSLQPWIIDSQLAAMTDTVQKLEALRGASLKSARQGHLYRVDLPDDAIARMLDWDAPLSKQPEAVRKAIAPLLRDTIEARPYGGGWGALEPDAQAVRELYTKSGQRLGLYSSADAENLNVTGSAVLKALGKGDKESWRASEILRQQGVPGVRYLDGVSRMGHGGTRNYVVFPGNEGLLTILGRE